MGTLLPYFINLPPTRTKCFALSFLMHTAKRTEYVFCESHNLGLTNARVNTVEITEKGLYPQLVQNRYIARDFSSLVQYVHMTKNYTYKWKNRRVSTEEQSLTKKVGMQSNSTFYALRYKNGPWWRILSWRKLKK